jgi:hypothetical protein
MSPVSEEVASATAKTFPVFGRAATIDFTA